MQRQLAYTTEQLAKQLSTSRNLIYELHRYGLLVGIKKGNGWIYSSAEVEQFLDAVQGMDIGNAEAIERTANIIKERHNKSKKEKRA